MKLLGVCVVVLFAVVTVNGQKCSGNGVEYDPEAEDFSTSSSNSMPKARRKIQKELKSAFDKDPNAKKLRVTREAELFEEVDDLDDEYDHEERTRRSADETGMSLDDAADDLLSRNTRATPGKPCPYTSVFLFGIYHRRYGKCWLWSPPVKTVRCLQACCKGKFPLVFKRCPCKPSHYRSRKVIVVCQKKCCKNWVWRIIVVRYPTKCTCTSCF